VPPNESQAIDPAIRRYLKVLTVNDKMQRGYRYALVAPTGRNFNPEFRPELTPKKMLELGVFCGKYMTDCRKEFPASWFTRAKLAPSGDCSLNYFGVSMLANRYQYGATEVGFIPMTRAAGSNGIVAIILAAVCQKRMLARSSAGKQSGATSPRSSDTVNQVIRRVDRVSGRHCFIGRTTVENFECLPAVASSHQEARCEARGLDYGQRMSRPPLKARWGGGGISAIVYRVGS
jgi:hypothetical protein